MFKTANQVIILSFSWFIGKRRKASFPWSTLKTCQKLNEARQEEVWGAGVILPCFTTGGDLLQDED